MGKVGLSFSGRELFDFNPEWAEDEDENAIEVYERADSDHEENETTVIVAEDLFETADLEGLDDE